MNFQISVPDGSLELEELNDVITKLNAENPSKPITAGQYLQNIIMGYFGNRVLQAYKGYAAKQNIATLKEAFGDLDEVRKGK